MISAVTTVSSIRLIIDTIITSHVGVAYLLERNTQGTPLHHGFNVLISAECVCVEPYP